MNESIRWTELAAYLTQRGISKNIRGDWDADKGQYIMQNQEGQVIGVMVPDKAHPTDVNMARFFPAHSLA
jgi:hypothetical protein